MPLLLPSVTIAVPAFNHGPYVLQALDSMLDSGIPDIEIVICDDASTDDTCARIESWQAQHVHRFTRIIFLRHTRNTGLCQCLNDIIAVAQGDLIHVIASDDYFLPDGLFTKTRFMAEHPEWDAAFCDGQAVGLDGQLYSPSLVADSPYDPTQLSKTEGIAAELLYHWGPPVHQMTWRRTAYQIHGGGFAYDPGVFCEDYDSALWAASRHALGYNPAVCQAYRCRSWPQTSNRSSLREYRDCSFILAKHAPSFPPSVQAGMRLLSAFYHYSAIGDDDMVSLLWRQFLTHRSAYEYHLAHPASPAPPGPNPDPAAELIAELKNQRSELVQQLNEAKQKWRKAVSSGKKNQAALASSMAALSAARHLLRYHSANPLRALHMWWRRREITGMDHKKTTTGIS